MPMDYEARCIAAATSQGLDPITEALTEAEIVHGVAQTGGFCMVILVQRTEGIWGVINDEGTNLAVWYPGTTWQDGEEEGPSFFPKTIPDLVALVKEAPALV